MIVVRVLAFVAGAVVVLWVLRSAIRTMVIPRGEQVHLTRWVFSLIRQLYVFRANRRHDVEGRAAVLASYAPAGLLVLAASWALLVIAAFVPMYWALDQHDLPTSIYLSGSSLTTLGFVQANGSIEIMLSVIEALLGLGIVALLISYLPTIYGLFNRREVEVTKLDVRAGSPPTAIEMLVRFQRIGWLEQLDDTWASWEDWFSLVEESHTSHPSLVFFRSQRPNSSWITCSGAVLDTAAISMSVLDLPNSPHAAVMMRSGFMCLRAIARYFGVPFDPDPAPNAPISIHREEFDVLVATLEEAGLPIRADREQAWRDYAGWRVNYDVPLLALCAVAMAPPTPWSSDRIEGLGKPTLRHRRWHIDPLATPPSW